MALRAFLRLSACAFPRPSAIASAKFANRIVNHSQSVIEPMNHAGASPSPPRASKKRSVVRAGADADDEHHRIANLNARVEFGEGVASRRAQDSAVENT